MPTKIPSAPPEAAGGLLALAADWYWQQDDGDRFIAVEHYNPNALGPDASTCLGRTAAEMNLATLGPNRWPVLGVQEDASRIRDRVVHWLRDDGSMRYLSVSAECRSDQQGRAIGWQGLVRDVTGQCAAHDQLAQLQAAIDASPEMIYLIDSESLRFVYVNDIACELTGYTRDELLDVPPYDLVMIEPAQMRREFAEVLRDGGSTQQMRSRTREGQVSIIEVRRRAIRVNGRTLIVSLVNDISQRKQARVGA